MQPKWIAIRASAVIAILGSLATLAMGGLMLLSMLKAPPPTGPAAPPFPMKTIGAVMAAICAGLCAWGIWTAVAIFMRRGWARISIVVFAILLAFMGGSGGVAMAFIQFPVQPEAPPQLMAAVRWGLVAFYGVLTAIGVWWLVLFNSKSTKEYFARTGPDEPSARPLSISVIAWFLLAGTPMFAASALFRMPAFVFGTVLTGWGAGGVYLAFTAVQLYLGAGLLRLQERARIGAIVYLCVMSLSSVLTLTPPGYAAKLETLQREMPAFLRAGGNTAMPQPAGLFVAIGLVFLALPVWFLVRRREAFVKIPAMQ